MANPIDAATALADIRTAMISMDQRIAILQGNIADLSNRLDTHENIHDPIIPVVQALRTQLTTMGPQIDNLNNGMTDQIARTAAVDNRLTALTTQMRDSGLTTDIAANMATLEARVSTLMMQGGNVSENANRLTAIESQMGGIMTHLAHIRVRVSQEHSLMIGNMKTMGDSIANLQSTISTDYPSMITSIQERITANEREIMNLNAKIDNVTINMPSGQYIERIQKHKFQAAVTDPS